MCSCPVEDASPQIEIIPFAIPTEAKLFVPNLAWPVQNTKDELIEHLRLKFSNFGLLHNVFADQSTSKETMIGWADVDSYFAFITFYSNLAAQEALSKLNKTLTIEGRDYRIFKSNKKRNKVDEEQQHLSLSHCEELANFYLGHDGWNSQVLYLKKEDEVMVGSDIHQTYCCAIRLTFKGRDKAVEGAGLADAKFSSSSPDQKCAEIGKARKMAKAAAMKHAFAKLLLVVVDSNKVRLEVDNSKLDPFYFDPLWEKYEANVKEADYEVPEADSITL